MSGSHCHILSPSHKSRAKSWLSGRTDHGLACPIFDMAWLSATVYGEGTQPAKNVGEETATTLDKDKDKTYAFFALWDWEHQWRLRDPSDPS